MFAKIKFTSFLNVLSALVILSLLLTSCAPVVGLEGTGGQEEVPPTEAPVVEPPAPTDPRSLKRLQLRHPQPRHHLQLRHHPQLMHRQKLLQRQRLRQRLHLRLQLIRLLRRRGSLKAAQTRICRRLVRLPQPRPLLIRRRTIKAQPLLPLFLIRMLDWG